MSTDPLRRPPVVSLVWQQFLYQNKVFWRTPIAAFFTIVFPLMLLVLFTAIFGNEEIEGLGITTAQYFTPGLAVFAAVSATYTNLAIGTAIARDNGILKRIRGAPIPPWGYIAGRVVSSVYLAFLAMALMMAVGVVFYGVQIIARTLPAALLTFVVGVSCFAALGMLVAAISPNGDATPAITNATLLPVAFISNIFFPIENPPRWMEIAGNFFPLKAFAEAFRDAFDPTLTGSQFHWPQIGYLLLWGVVAGLLAIRFFRWEPSAGSTSRRRRRDESKPVPA
ncbi:MAG: ABC transporter permease [Acidimicrobiia bacterium]